MKSTFHSGKPAIGIRAAVLTITFICCLILNFYRNAIVEVLIAGENQGIPASRSDIPDPWPLEGPFHERLAMALDIPPIRYSDTDILHPSNFSSSEVVVGMVYRDQAIAIPLHALASPSSHIMLFEIQGEAFAITHCDISGCSRLFKGPDRTNVGVYEEKQTVGDSSRGIDLRVGGLDHNGEMVLLLDGTRYAQRSTEIPLDDHEFQIVLLSEWMRMNPETVIVCPTEFEAHHTPVPPQWVIGD